MLDINTIVYKLPIEVDTTKIIGELEALVLPYYMKKTLDPNWRKKPNCNISITGLPDTPLSNWFNLNNGTMSVHKDGDTGETLTKNYQKYTLGYAGPWRREVNAYYEGTNTGDKDLIAWHPRLLKSEMFRLKNAVATYLGIDNNLRCRASFSSGGTGGSRIINFHSDPHTPWRVHVTLKTGPNTKWLFRDVEQNKIIEWYQPLGSVWLVRTGNIQHTVNVGDNEIRWQLFYHIWKTNLGPNYHQIA